MAHRTSRIESIAVLPLENFSRDPDQEFFADGMTEQLITDLSKIGTLTVKSRTSVMQYKGNHRKPLPEIAKELGVDAVVEGSVQRSGDRVRITAQLIQAATDKHLWAETYDRDLRDVLTLQAEVTRSIADQIRITLTPEEKARLGSRRQVDPEVFQLYLKGQYDLSPSGTDGRKSVTDFQQAIAKDPSYAPAHAGLAMAYGGLASVVAAPKDVMPKAKAEALRALELDETLPEAHVALAQVLMFYEWNWDGAEKEIRRAIELNPSSADAHHLYGIYLDTLSKSEPALREMERAHTLDPLSLMITGDWLSTLIHARQYDRVIEEARKLVAVNPDYAFAHAWMGLAYAQKKDFPPAIAELRKAQDLQPGYTMDHFLAVVLAAAGNKEEARKLVAKIESLSQHQYVCAYEVAEVHVALGDNEAAQKWLQRGVKEQCDCLVFLRAEPWMDPYRLDPRYEALVKRVFGSR
jgi:TolB-like protein/tetratricopeptide (TPR) repeat protein